MPENDVQDLIIIGGGPAGYTAALYAARANLNPLVIEGITFGGQLMITSDVENYPGYPEGILGPEMMQDFRRQAERFGAEYITDDVTAVDFSERPFRVEVDDDAYYARAVIVARGERAPARARLGAHAAGPRRLVLRRLRRGLLPEQERDRRRRRRLGDGGGGLPHEVRGQGDRRPPARRVPRLADHARPREGATRRSIGSRTPSSRRSSARRAR